VRAQAFDSPIAPAAMHARHLSKIRAEVTDRAAARNKAHSRSDLASSGGGSDIIVVGNLIQDNIVTTRRRHLYSNYPSRYRSAKTISRRVAPGGQRRHKCTHEAITDNTVDAGDFSSGSSCASHFSGSRAFPGLPSVPLKSKARIRPRR